MRGDSVSSALAFLERVAAAPRSPREYSDTGAEHGHRRALVGGLSLDTRTQRLRLLVLFDGTRMVRSLLS